MLRIFAPDFVGLEAYAIAPLRVLTLAKGVGIRVDERLVETYDGPPLPANIAWETCVAETDTYTPFETSISTAARCTWRSCRNPGHFFFLPLPCSVVGPNAAPATLGPVRRGKMVSRATCPYLNTAGETVRNPPQLRRPDYEQVFLDIVSSLRALCALSLVDLKTLAPERGVCLNPSSYGEKHEGCNTM